MKIECKLHRKDGTVVELGTKTYHFAPQADGAHVADVVDEAHQDRFLSISEGYGIYRGKAETAPAPAATDAADTNGDGTVDDAEERASLAAQYEAKMGKKPHYNLSLEKIRAALEAE